MHPAAAFDCAEATALDVGERTEHLVSEHRDPQVQLGSKQLAEGTLRAGHLALELCRQRAVARQPQASCLDRELRELLAYVRMLPRGFALELHFLREVEQLTN